MSEPYVIQAKNFESGRHERLVIESHVAAPNAQTWIDGGLVSDCDEWLIIVRDKPQTLEDVLTEHALWLNVSANGQPKSCGCGHMFFIGESISGHVADAIREAGLA